VCQHGGNTTITRSHNPTPSMNPLAMTTVHKPQAAASLWWHMDQGGMGQATAKPYSHRSRATLNPSHISCDTPA
jgi:hypothetical protein